MAYSPIPYTDQANVTRILRTSNTKIRIGSAAGEISSADVDAYIIDASEKIDAFIRANALATALPVITYSEKPELTYAAKYLSAYLIWRSLYSSYRVEQIGAGVQGWYTDAMDNLNLLMKNIDAGVYPDLSPSTGGMNFITSDQFFQTQIGICGIDQSLRSDKSDTVPIKQGNIGPFSSGSLQ